jgi:hypothetical protein
MMKPQPLPYGFPKGLQGWLSDPQTNWLHFYLINESILKNFLYTFFISHCSSVIHQCPPPTGQQSSPFLAPSPYVQIISKLPNHMDLKIN